MKKLIFFITQSKQIFNITNNQEFGDFIFLYAKNHKEMFRMADHYKKPIEFVGIDEKIYPQEQIFLVGLKKILLIDENINLKTWADAYIPEICLFIDRSLSFYKFIQQLEKYQQKNKRPASILYYSDISFDNSFDLQLLKKRAIGQLEIQFINQLFQISILEYSIPPDIILFDLSETTNLEKTISMLRHHYFFKNTVFIAKPKLKDFSSLNNDLFDEIMPEQYDTYQTIHYLQKTFIKYQRLQNATDPQESFLRLELHAKTIETEITRCLRFGTPLSYSIIEFLGLDHLTVIYGPLMQNLVLSLSFEIIKERVRTSDVILKNEKNQIIIILPQAVGVEAFKVLHAIKQKLLDKFKKNNILKDLKIIGGVSELPECSDFEKLHKLACKRLYKAKQENTNYICLQGDT